tara:strand:- start:890 stop:1414 length:525 start_codon:yes stop_codon:yes gene_type:complete
MFLSINNKINLTLCGMMGSGKSSIGKILAKKINYSFYDIDKLIEKKTNKSIISIFKDEGEKYFRMLEESVTLDILNKKNSIISLGGGAITNKHIRDSIQKNSFNIYLKVNLNILKKRLQKSKSRPLLIENNLNNTLAFLIDKREKYYNKADLIIDNELNITRTTENILNKIINE